MKSKEKEKGKSRKSADKEEKKRKEERKAEKAERKAEKNKKQEVKEPKSGKNKKKKAKYHATPLKQEESKSDIVAKKAAEAEKSDVKTAKKEETTPKAARKEENAAKTKAAETEQAAVSASGTRKAAAEKKSTAESDRRVPGKQEVQPEREGSGDIEGYVDVFRALGDESRMQILKLLAGKELCGAELLRLLPIVQSTLSHHMKVLCESGLVACRRQGRWTYYTLNKTVFVEVSDCLKRQAEE